MLGAFEIGTTPRKYLNKWTFKNKFPLIIEYIMNILENGLELDYKETFLAKRTLKIYRFGFVIPKARLKTPK